MKAIVYDKTEYLDDNKTLLINEQNLIHASTCLSPSALRLYFYLCIKEKNSVAILDGARFQKDWNVSHTQYYAAIAQLIEKKFLAFDKENNIYHFNRSTLKEGE